MEVLSYLIMRVMTEEERYKAILLQTMKVFIAFCKEHGITYYACGGTAIGAVRHGGVIPWDDDIDVYMDRENYERFIQASRELKGAYKDYEVVECGQDGYYLQITKFADKRTTIWEMESCPFIFGVYVDIFVLDRTQGSFPEIARRADRYRRLVQSYLLGQEKYTWSLVKGRLRQHGFLRGLLVVAYHTLYCRPFRRFQWHRAERYLKQLLELGGDQGFCYGLEMTREHEVFPMEWFGTPVEMPFEDFVVSMPQNYDAYLRQQYGDYMQLPPEDQRYSLHMRYFMDLEKRWTIEEAREHIHREKQKS